MVMVKVKATGNRGDNVLDKVNGTLIFTLTLSFPTVTVTPNTNPHAKENFDDEEGYLTFAMHELFNDRYEVTKVLGKGVFSTVLQAKDTRFPPEQVPLSLPFASLVVHASIDASIIALFSLLLPTMFTLHIIMTRDHCFSALLSHFVRVSDRPRTKRAGPWPSKSSVTTI